MILLTGGTGFIGQEVVQQLRALEIPLRLLMRTTTVEQLRAEYGEGGMTSLGFEVAEGDILQAETLPAALAGVSVIINLVGIIVEEKTTYQQVHVEGTRNLLHAAEQAGVPRFIQMSALGARADATTRYHQTKWAAEELVRQSGLQWTIFRPSLIYGYDQRDRVFKLLLRLLNPPLNLLYLRSFGLINGGRSKIQPVSLTEVSFCIAQATVRPETAGYTFDLVGPEPVTFRDFVVQLAEADHVVVQTQNPWLNLILRVLLWFGVVGGAFLILFSKAAPNWLTQTQFYQSLLQSGIATYTLGAIWVVIILLCAGLLLLALRWTSVILVPLPLFLVQLGARLFGYGEPVKLALEDNVGDPHLAAQSFGYQPQSLATGIELFLGHSRATDGNPSPN